MPERAPVLTGAAAFAHALYEDLQDFAHLRISHPPSWVRLAEGWTGLVEWQWLPSDIATHPPAWVHIGRASYRCSSILDFGRRAGIVVVGEPSA
jgi:hypothetical protein